MEVHGSEISRALGEAVAAAVHDKAADPVEFLRDYFAKASKHAEAQAAAEERRTRELDSLQQLLESERGARALLEQRVSKLEEQREKLRSDDFHCSAKDIDAHAQGAATEMPASSMVAEKAPASVKQAVGHEEPINTTPVEFVEQHTTAAPNTVAAPVFELAMDQGFKMFTAEQQVPDDVINDMNEMQERTRALATAPTTQTAKLAKWKGYHSVSGAEPSREGRPAFGYAEEQGVRPSAEDALLLGAAVGAAGDMHAWAVCDGHGGARASKFLVAALPSAIEGIARHGRLPLDESELRDAYESLDAQLLDAASREGGWSDGTTSLLVLIQGSTLQLVQVGDCQAVLCGADSAIDVTPALHRPSETTEMARLLKAGAEVTRNARDGVRVAGLAVSRAFGDLPIKQTTGIDCMPDVVTRELSDSDELLIVACDGLWDYMSPETAAEIARSHRLPDGTFDVGAAAEALTKQAVDEYRSQDNVSAIVIALGSR